MRSTAVRNLLLLFFTSLVAHQQPRPPHTHSPSSSVCAVHRVHLVYDVLKHSWTSRLALAPMCQTTPSINNQAHIRLLLHLAAQTHSRDGFTSGISGTNSYDST